MMRAKAIGSKTKQCRGTMATNVTAPSLAKKTRGLTVSADRACSHRKSGENKYSHGMPNLADKICISQPICYGHRQET